MKIKDILQRDPATHPLVNRGQARIADRADRRVLSELRGELSSFVCEGQYADGIQRIVRSFIDDLGRPNQRGAWVSGFFGSGKSHLLKMLCHLWCDTPFDDGVTARSLVPAMPEDLKALLRELDVAGRRAGGLLAAAGSLPSGTTDHVRLTVLAILLRATGLPEQYPQARFCLWLHEQGHFDAVKAAVEAAGRPFENELNNLYVSGPIARALLAADPAFAPGEAEAKQLLKTQFPPLAGDIATADFLRVAREALLHASGNGRLPCTLIVLDEAQQYIGDVNDRSVLVTEVAEAVEKQLESRVMIVAAGQSALTDMPLLQKLMDRFTIRIPLSDADVETVTRKVVLQKKPGALDAVRAFLDRHSGEISRQLQGTRVGEIAGDRRTVVDDYPLLPSRRRFWDQCFRQIDEAGTYSQLRSQLRILHDAVAALSDRPLGALVAGDVLFDGLAPEMVNTAVLLHEINERIVEVGKTEGPLAQRLCGLVFLIGRLPRGAGADIGVRASKEHIADLAIDDLAADNGKLRSEVEATLAGLAEKGVLMRLGEEYRLQTRQGSEWDREFRSRRARLNNDAATIQFRREELLHGRVDRILRGLRMVQGAAKEPRSLLPHHEAATPPVDGSGIPVWIRDGWTDSERNVVDAARAAGADDPVIHVFIPRRSADDLRRLIAEAAAAQQTLDQRGNPTEAEGQEARHSMESRLAVAGNRRDLLVEEIVASARVFQGGGHEVLLSSLAERVEAAARDSLLRLFPRFGEADNAAWPTAIRRARDGADQPLQPLGHMDATEKHPVCRQLLSGIGAGATGADLRKTLAAPPCGWPRDAVDAALIALHRSRHVTATLNGAALPPGVLDQNRIARAHFRVEKQVLSVQDRLRLRKLFQSLALSCKSGEEEDKAEPFLAGLADLAASAGGPPPLPAAPAATAIDDVRRLAGNERLAAMVARADAWERDVQAWRQAKALIEARLPVWQLLQRLAVQAEGIGEVAPLLADAEAIESGRLLLEDADAASIVCKGLAERLRRAVQAGVAAHEKAFAAAMATLDANPAWRGITPAQRDRIAGEAGLAPPVRPRVDSDEALAASLEARSLASLRAEADAMTARAARAIEQAAKLLEPKMRTLTLERATLRDAAEVEAWSERQRQALLAAVASGPVLVN